MNPTLVDLIKQKFTQVCISQHVVFQETTVTRYNDGSLEYLVKVLKSPNAAPSESKSDVFNPFLNPEPSVVISQISDDYVLILNKYPVLENHCLLIRNKFVRQENPLEQSDFNSIWMFLNSIDSEDPFVFYNSGKNSGASQPHRHFQFVMLPQNNFPYLQIINKSVKSDQTLCRSLPFYHKIVKLNPNDTGLSIYTQYSNAMLSFQKTLNLDTVDYNLIVTLSWMMIVPRRDSNFEDISINSLGVLGMFLIEPGSSNPFNRISLREIYARICYESINC